MKMQESDFRHALEIITRNNRITVSFNTPIADNYSQVSLLSNKKGQFDL